MSRLATAVIVAGLVALMGVPRPSRAQQSSAAFQRLWYQNYDEGVRAALKGDWAAAIPALEAAKRGGPSPGRRVLFQGDRVDVFNPDYYLGLAYNATKRFADAEAALRRVADDKLLMPGDKLYDELRRQTSRASYERVVLDADRALRAGRFTDVEKAVAAVIGSGADDGRAGELAKQAKDGAATLAYANPDSTQRPLPPTNVRIDDPPAANLPAEDPKVATNDPKTPVIEPTKEATPAPPVPVNRPPEQKAPPALANANPANLRGELGLDENAITLRGTMAYYEGNYDEAIRILTPAFQSDPPSNVVALYMACSRAALVASGRASNATLAEAREMYTYARGGAIDRHLRYISPRVREMLGDVPATARQ